MHKTQKCTTRSWFVSVTCMNANAKKHLFSLSFILSCEFIIWSDTDHVTNDHLFVSVVFNNLFSLYRSAMWTKLLLFSHRGFWRWEWRWIFFFSHITHSNYGYYLNHCTQIHFQTESYVINFLTKILLCHLHEKNWSFCVCRFKQKSIWKRGSIKLWVNNCVQMVFNAIIS